MLHIYIYDISRLRVKWPTYVPNGLIFIMFQEDASSIDPHSVFLNLLKPAGYMMHQQFNL